MHPLEIRSTKRSYLQGQLGEQQQALATAQEAVAQLTQQVQEASLKVQAEGSVAAAKLEAARPEATDEGAAAMSQLQVRQKNVKA